MKDKEQLSMKDYALVQWWASGKFPEINLIVIKVDSRVLISFLPFALHMHEYTLYLAIFFVIVFGALGYMRLSVPVSLQKIRTLIAGRNRSVVSNKRRRRRFNHG